MNVSRKSIPAVAALALSPLLAPAPARGLEPDPRLAEAIDGITAGSLMPWVEDLVAFGTRRWDHPGGMAAQAYVEDAFRAMPLDEVFVHSFDGGSDNVVGVLLGSLWPERIHVLGAHYDSISKAGWDAPSPGADDNASGTAAVLEAARAISALGVRPAETIWFIAFSGEEPGMVGSGDFVRDSLAAGRWFADMVNADVIGYRAPGTRADLSIASSKRTPGVLALIEKIREVAGAYLPDWPFETGPDCACSDHVPFVDAGIPAVFLAEDHEFFSPYFHGPDDVVGTSLNSPEELEGNARLAAAAVAVLAGPLDPSGPPRFVRGDADGDGEVDLSDAVGVLEYLYIDGVPPSCQDAADGNDDGSIDISDPVRILLALFAGEGPLPDPVASCGEDPTADPLDCQSPSPCD